MDEPHLVFSAPFWHLYPDSHRHPVQLFPMAVAPTDIHGGTNHQADKRYWTQPEKSKMLEISYSTTIYQKVHIFSITSITRLITT